MQNGRTLEQIIAELNPTFQPQVKSLQDRAATIPGQIQAEEAGLQGKQTEAFGNILSGARRRGLGFSGIPLAEQAQYTSTEYLPALARLRQSGREQAMSLQDAILGINERRDTLAQQIRQTEQDRLFQAREAEANRRAQAAAAQATFGSLGGFGGGAPTDTPAQTLPKISRTSKGGFNFTDAYGTPVTAADYVRLYNAQGGQLTYRQLLQRMANDGDSNARIALNYVGDDAKFGNAPSQYRGALSALGATGSFQSSPVRRSTAVSPISNLPTIGIPRR